MNAELTPFKNGEHNSESASTSDRVITLFKREGIATKLITVVDCIILYFVGTLTSVLPD